MPATIRIEILMSPFPAWQWEARDAATHVVIKRFKTDAALERWLERNTVKDSAR